MTPEHNVHVSDSREVRADVSDMPPLYTAMGNRPIDPVWIRIQYSIGSDRYYIEIGGRKLFQERRHSRRDNTFSVRRFNHDDVVPSWIAALVDEYRPVTTRDGWWR